MASEQLWMFPASLAEGEAPPLPTHVPLLRLVKKPLLRLSLRARRAWALQGGLFGQTGRSAPARPGRQAEQRRLAGLGGEPPYRCDRLS